MKLKAQDLFSQGIDEMSIDKLKSMLEQGGLAPDKIADITKTLEDNKSAPATSETMPKSQTGPKSPLQPGNVQSIGKVKIYAKDNVKIRICGKDADQFEDEIETLVERLMDDGISPDQARQQAEETVFNQMNIPPGEEQYIKLLGQNYLDETDDNGMEDLDISEEKKKINKEDVLDWFKENPNPTDEEVHDWAEDMGFEPSDLETVIYEIVTDHVKMLEEMEEGFEEDEEEQTLI